MADAEIGSTRDSSERRRAEEEAARRVQLQDQLAKLAASVSGVILSLRMDPKGRFSMPFASASLGEVFPLSPQEVATDCSRALALIHPDDIDQFRAGIARSAQTMTPWHDRFRVCNPRLGIIWVEGRSVPAREPDGSILWHGYLHDVTQQKLAVDAVRVSEERLRQATEATRMGTWDRDLKTDRIFWSPVEELLMGYEPGRFPGTSQAFLELIHPDSLPAHAAAQQRAQSGDGFFQVELHFLLRDGRERWGLMGGQMLRDADNQPVRIVGTHIDITDRKRLEEQLRQAQKMEGIGQLAGGAAHDFNNILTAMMMQLELLQDDPAQTADGREGLSELMQQAERAASLTRQLLLFSRRSAIRLAALNPNDIVENLLKMLRRLIGEHIVLEWCHAANLPQVLADPGMIEQLLMNLVVNARDAMPQGGQVTIATESVEVDSSHVQRKPRARPGRSLCSVGFAHPRARFTDRAARVRSYSRQVDFKRWTCSDRISAAPPCAEIPS